MTKALLTTMTLAAALTLSAAAYADYLRDDGTGDLYNEQTGDYYYFDGEGYEGPDGYYERDGAEGLYAPNGEYYWATGDGDFASY